MAQGTPCSSRAQPLGQVTRGTTGHNRLRRSDRWLVHSARVRAVLQSAAEPLVVDLGYGALPVTTLELAARLREVRADVRVLGLEIDPHRVEVARAAAGPGVEFALGGWGTNQHLGTPWNPWDLETQRVPGGSSSGSGVAVAARLAPWAIGTDTGGSIRQPGKACDAKRRNQTVLQQHVERLKMMSGRP